MAIIQNIDNGRELVLQHQHTIGRSSTNTWRLDAPDISRKHAIIFWDNNSWQLTDFSTNGTRVNNDIVHHSTRQLCQSDLLQFTDEDNAIWRLTTLSKPVSFFQALKPSEDFIELDAVKLLPDAIDPLYAVFQNPHLEWVLDDGISETVLMHGAQYHLGESSYEFVENECLEETQRHIDITKNACFQLKISQDEENVSSSIRINDLVLELGTRAYNHLLLVLAREKKEHLESGLDGTHSGWIQLESVCNILGKELLKEVDNYYINILIHRLRKHLNRVKPYGHLFANLVERKKGALRFGMIHFEIEKEPL